MRRMCGKSLYQEASAVRRTDHGKRVESAKEKATKIGDPAQSDRRAGEITRGRTVPRIVPPSPKSAAEASFPKQE
jgi:hypothetical protein